MYTNYVMASTMFPYELTACNGCPSRVYQHVSILRISEVFTLAYSKKDVINFIRILIWMIIVVTGMIWILP